MSKPEPLTEDDYLVSATVDEFAVDDAAALDDENDEFDDSDQVINTKIIQDIREYCETAIAEHNSFDVLHLPQNATPEEKQAVFDEMFNHKGLVHHLRQIQGIINDKIKEG